MPGDGVRTQASAQPLCMHRLGVALEVQTSDAHLTTAGGSIQCPATIDHALLQILMFSYGSGAAGSMFMLRGRRSGNPRFNLNLLSRKV
jgi:hypothetical protein